MVLLKMKAAEHSLAGSRVVILDKLLPDSLILKAAPAKRLEEKTAFVCKHSRLDEQQVGYGGFGDFHGVIHSENVKCNTRHVIRSKRIKKRRSTDYKDFTDVLTAEAQSE
jgi:hypothetical protein